MAPQKKTTVGKTVGLPVSVPKTIEKTPANKKEETISHTPECILALLDSLAKMSDHAFESKKALADARNTIAKLNNTIADLSNQLSATQFGLLPPPKETTVYAIKLLLCNATHTKFNQLCRETLPILREAILSKETVAVPRPTGALVKLPIEPVSSEHAKWNGILLRVKADFDDHFSVAEAFREVLSPVMNVVLGDIEDPNNPHKNTSINFKCSTATGLTGYTM